MLAALVAADLPGSIVNPARVRAFAEGTGQLAKTDRIDAKVLASYGAYMKPAPSALPSSVRAKLKELLSYRAQIGEEITARCAQLKLYGAPTACKRERKLPRSRPCAPSAPNSSGRSRASLPAMRNSRRPFGIPQPPRPRSAPSWRPLWWPNCRRSDRCYRHRIAALTGLAPFPCDSGRRRGYRAIRGGHSDVRKALFNAARVAIQHNHKIKAFYERLRASGKPGKVAIVAAMRKLLTILNAMVKKGQTWQPSMA